MQISSFPGPFRPDVEPSSQFGRPNAEEGAPNQAFQQVELVGALPDASLIASAIAKEIHSGRMEEGSMLSSERQLCDRFGVGRSIIREAIRQLEMMGLVELRKGHRPRVAYPSFSGLLASISDASRLFFSGTEGGAHMEQARLFLETSMVRYAAHSATRAQIAKMVAAIEKADAVVDDLPRFRDADVAFHRALAEVPGNPIFIALHDAFVGGLMRARPDPADTARHNRRSNDEHKGVVQAIIARDAAAAEAILTKHLTRNFAVYVNHVLGPTAGQQAMEG
jgi:DNA-binding FadR family transcriptional regulator